MPKDRKLLLVLTIFVYSLLVVLFGVVVSYVLFFRGLLFSIFLKVVSIHPLVNFNVTFTSILCFIFFVFFYFFSYLFLILKAFVFSGYVTSHFFYVYNTKFVLGRYLIGAFREQFHADIDILLSFYNAAGFLYSFHLIILLSGLLVSYYFFSDFTLPYYVTWTLDEEEDYASTFFEEIWPYESLQTNPHDPEIYFTSYGFGIEYDKFLWAPNKYRRADRSTWLLQEETLEYQLEDPRSDLHNDRLDFGEVYIQVFNSVLKYFNSVLPLPIQRLFKFSNTEVVIRDCVIALFYFPCVFVIVLKYFTLLVKIKFK